MSTQEQFHCPVRSEWVAATPEEEVRQNLLSKLTERYAYPKEMLLVEQSLAQLPHLKMFSSKVPNRRIDILCYYRKPDVAGLIPLLLIECKAVPLSDKMVSQVAGYNQYIDAPFIALVSQDEERLGFYDAGIEGYRFSSGLPTYVQLLEALQPH